MNPLIYLLVIPFEEDAFLNKLLDAEIVAMQCYQNNTLHINENELKIGDTVRVPLLEKEGILLSQKGKNCIAQLKKLGAIVTFQLS